MTPITNISVDTSLTSMLQMNDCCCFRCNNPFDRLGNAAFMTDAQHAICKSCFDAHQTQACFICRKFFVSKIPPATSELLLRKVELVRSLWQLDRDIRLKLIVEQNGYLQSMTDEEITDILKGLVSPDYMAKVIETIRMEFCEFFLFRCGNCIQGLAAIGLDSEAASINIDRKNVFLASTVDYNDFLKGFYDWVSNMKCADGSKIETINFKTMETDAKQFSSQLIEMGTKFGYLMSLSFNK